MAMTLPRPTTRKRTQHAVIDGDIHNALPSETTLLKYLPERWRRHHETFGMRSHSGSHYPRANQNAARTDSWPPSGLPPGGDLDFMREQLLDYWDIEYGVLNPLVGAGAQTNVEYAAALSTAVNLWQIAEWTEPEPRLRASVVVPYEDGELAAAEIDRWGGNANFVQVLLIIRTAEPLGRRKYWRMYEAAVRNNLPIGIHFGGAGGGPITGVGFPSYYIEDHCGMMSAFQDQVASLALSGVFDTFPELKIVLIEGGFGWLAPLMWRLDRAYARLKDEVPHLKRLPSEYIRSNIWFTTQPMEEPPNSRDFRVLLDQLQMDDKIMFATDYPHWDFDAPDQALPIRLETELEWKIMAGNARALYGLAPREP